MQNKQASIDKQEKNEAWHKIAVKIMRWKDGNKNQNAEVEAVAKITPKEWKEYCDKIISINVSVGKSATQEKLKELEKIIKKHNGFE